MNLAIKNIQTKESEDPANKYSRIQELQKTNRLSMPKTGSGPDKVPRLIFKNMSAESITTLFQKNSIKQHRSDLQKQRPHPNQILKK